MSVRRMTREELHTVLSWAATEGWNPGVADADAFYAADPEGFFVKIVDGVPAAAVSVVNHDEAYAFLGLYICAAAYRGHGYGLEVWEAGLAHAGNRTVGLDGVPAQQENYVKSGFAPAGETLRYEGVIDAAPSGEVRAATETDVASLLAMDRAVTGHDLRRYLTGWFTPSPTRQTFTIVRDGQIAAFATARACLSGHKIGPLYAHDSEDAMTVMRHAAHVMGSTPSYIDIPDSAPAFRALLAAEGFAPVFGTARMYRGTPPAGQAPAFHAVATLELG